MYEVKKTYFQCRIFKVKINLSLTFDEWKILQLLLFFLSSGRVVQSEDRIGKRVTTAGRRWRKRKIEKRKKKRKKEEEQEEWRAASGRQRGD